MNPVKKNYDTVKRLWHAFLREYPSFSKQQIPDSFYFCDNKDDADECAALVVQGIKQATATSWWWYKKNNEPLPKVGNIYIVTDWEGNARAIIEVSKVKQVPFSEVTPDFAAIEGEGDKSLEYWKKVHRAYYTREMSHYNEKFDEDMIIVCEYFKTLFTR